MSCSRERAFRRSKNPLPLGEGRVRGSCAGKTLTPTLSQGEREHLLDRPSRQLAARPMQRILIVKLSSMGDVLHTMPAAQALRLRFPAAHLGWAVERGHAELLKGQPWLDEIIPWHRGGGFRQFAAFLGALRRQPWDIAIDFQGLFRSGLVTRLSGAKRRIGYVLGREKAHWFYTDRVPHPTWDRHAVDRYHDLVRVLGARLPDLPLDRPYLDGRPPVANELGRQLFPLHPSEEDRQQVTSWLAEAGIDREQERLILINPHARREANRWPPRNFAALARRLGKIPNVRVALIAGPAAADLCEFIQREAGENLLRADGRLSILGSAELIGRASVLVTGDTGPMHLAAAMGTRTVCLIGATHERRTGPYAADAIIVKSGIECSPCYARRCPLHYDPPRCQEWITVEMVAAAVERQLELVGDGGSLFAGVPPAAKRSTHFPLPTTH